MRLNGLSSREAERSRREFGLNVITRTPYSLSERIFGTFRHRSLDVGKDMPFSVFCFRDEMFFSNVKVVRDGNMIEISPNQVVVGDMILLQKNDVVPADCTVAHGRIIAEQSVIDLPVEEKFPVPEKIPKTELPSRYAVYCGTVVLSGEAYVYVNAVGDKTLFAKNFSSRYQSACIPKKIKQLLKHNVSVNSSETADLVKQTNLIFFDKSFITQSETEVNELITGDLTAFSDLSDISFGFLADIVTGIGINNSSVAGGKNVTGGNRTDRALMKFLIESDVMETVVRKSAVSYEPFDSLKKMSKAKVRENGHNIVYLQGCWRKIISKCSSCININGSTVELNKHRLLEYIVQKTSDGFQAVAAAKGESESGKFTLICVVFMKDIISTDIIKPAVDAEIPLIMFTGEERENAVFAGEKSGLISNGRKLIMTSEDINSKSDEELKALLPELAVLAEVFTADKARIIRLAKESGYIVGVLIRNAEDFPCAKNADVSFALKSMPNGVKEYADVIFDDDSLSLSWRK